jgi:hypothetical protein
LALTTVHGKGACGARKAHRDRAARAGGSCDGVLDIVAALRAEPFCFEDEARGVNSPCVHVDHDTVGGVVGRRERGRPCRRWSRARRRVTAYMFNRSSDNDG